MMGAPGGVGQPILVVAAFISGRESRLKGGCSQDWLPHTPIVQEK